MPRNILRSWTLVDLESQLGHIQQALEPRREKAEYMTFPVGGKEAGRGGSPK